MYEKIVDVVSKWNSKRLVAAGGGGYAVYLLAATGTIPGAQAMYVIAGIVAAYLTAETVRPTKKKEDEEASE